MSAIEEQLKAWSHVDQVKFALWCAKKCVHLSGGGGDHVSIFSVKAIQTVEAWLLDQSEVNTEACRVAANAAGAAYAVNAAYYAAAAAAYSVHAAAHTATYAATYSVHAAAYAAHTAANAALNTTKEALLHEYVSEQLFGILESL